MRSALFIFLSFATGVAITIFALSRRAEPPPLPASVTPVAVAAPAKPPSKLTPTELLGLAERSASSDTPGREINRVARLLRARPEHADYWVRLGDTLLQQSRETLDTSLYALIQKIYFHAHQLDSSNPDSVVGLAWAAGASHHFEDSITWAGLALKIDPNLPAAYGILGDAAIEHGRYEEASGHYQKMLDLRPDMGSYSRAAHLLYLQGNAPRAMALMRQAIRAGGNHPEHTAWCVSALATMLCHEGAAPAAKKLVEDALKQAPANAHLLAAAGRARMAMGDDTGAIAAYEQSLARAEQHETLAALHDLYRATGREADATRTATRLREFHRKLQTQRVRGGEGQLARFLADRGEDLDEAVRLAETEHGHHRTAMAADTYAWALHRAGRSAEAAKVIRAALQRRVSDPSILYHAGMIEEAVGNAQDARRHLYAALSREPRFNPLHAPLAQTALTRLSSAPDPKPVERAAVAASH
jgi:tetratricopeptide (TPR) repeat protein